MAKITYLKFKKFPQNESFWRLDWVSTVERNENIDSEPKVLVHFSELTSYEGNALHSKSRTGNTEKIWLGIGQFPLFRIGSIWHKGYCLNYPGYQSPLFPSQLPLKSIKVTIDTNTVRKTTFSGQINIDNFVYRPIPKIYFDIGTNFKECAKGQLIIINSLTSDQTLIIPTFELFRFYYSCSTKVTKAVFKNDFSQYIDKNDSSLKPYGEAFLNLKHKCDSNDAWFFSRWLFDPNCAKQIENFHRKLITNNINNAGSFSQKNLYENHIDISFPFLGVTELQAYAKPIQLTSLCNKQKKWVHLVLGIESCSAPYPFDFLSIDRDLDPRKGDNSNDPSLIKVPPPHQKEVIVDEKSDDTANVTNEEEPKFSIPLEFNINYKNRFTALKSKWLHEKPKQTQKYKTTSRIPVVKIPFEQFGTGDGTHSNETNTGALSVKENETGVEIETINSEELETDLITFLKMVNLIRLKRKQWDIQSVSAFNGRIKRIDESDDFLTFFPKILPPCSSWHLITQEPMTPRTIAIFEIKTLTCFFYLIEIERKYGGAQKTGQSTLAIYNETRIKLDELELSKFLKATAIKNSWPSTSIMPELRRITTRHHKNRTIEQFADIIIKKLESH
jgi:hypothetical protein